MSLAKAVGTSDHNLQVDRAIDCVRRMLNEHEQRISKVSQSWQEWRLTQEKVERINNFIEEVNEYEWIISGLPRVEIFLEAIINGRLCRARFLELNFRLLSVRYA